MGPLPRPKPVSPVSPVADDPSAPFQMRGSSVTLLTLKLNDPENPRFFDELAETLSRAPGFYSHAPIVLDLSEVVRRKPIDLRQFCQRLRGLGLSPVGFLKATEDWEQAALAAGLAVFPAGRAADLKAVHGRPALLKRPGARLVDDPIRSGQQVYAPQGDLIVMAAVSRGAEILADGNIHVYGALHGRALAGVAGDQGARIICRKLDADLISIAGVYLVNEQIDPEFLGKAVQVRLNGDKLVFDFL